MRVRLRRRACLSLRGLFGSAAVVMSCFPLAPKANDRKRLRVGGRSIFYLRQFGSSHLRFGICERRRRPRLDSSLLSCGVTTALVAIAIVASMPRFSGLFRTCALPLAAMPSRMDPVWNSVVHAIPLAFLVRASVPLSEPPLVGTGLGDTENREIND